MGDDVDVVVRWELLIVAEVEVDDGLVIVLNPDPNEKVGVCSGSSVNVSSVSCGPPTVPN